MHPCLQLSEGHACAALVSRLGQERVAPHLAWLLQPLAKAVDPASLDPPQVMLEQKRTCKYPKIQKQQVNAAFDGESFTASVATAGHALVIQLESGARRQGSAVI